MAQLQIVEQVNADVLVFMLTGQLDFQARQLFNHAIEKAISTPVKHLILNFSQVSFINSAGLGLLMLAHNKLEKADIRLSLEVPDGFVREVMSLTNLGQKIPICLI